MDQTPPGGRVRRRGVPVVSAGAASAITGISSVPDGLGDVSLALFFTGGVSLTTWAEVGNLSREVALYARLARRLRAIHFVTYGGPGDRAHARAVAPIGVLPTVWRRWRRWTVWELLRRHGTVLAGVQVLKTNQVPGAEIALAVTRRFGQKLVVRSGYPYSRNVEYEGLSAAAVRRAVTLEREAFQRADAVVVTSERHRAWAIERHGLPPEKVHVVPNHVDTELFHPWATSPKTYDVAYVGRAGREKNIDWILTAVGRLAARGQAPRVLLVGGAARDRGLRERARGLPVEFAGAVPNERLPDLLRRCRVFVLASSWEGHPKALLEAMACGLACVGTRVVGICDEIEHLVTGYLAEPDPEALAGALAVVLGDESLQRRLGANARRWVEERYALDRVVEREVAVLRSVMGA